MREMRISTYMTVGFDKGVLSEAPVLLTQHISAIPCSRGE